MSPDNDPHAEETLFSAVLTPHRSLSKAGFLIVMSAFGGASFAAGMVFVALGAWPVFGFMGLDVLLVYWAFRANYRAASAFEEVTVTPSQLLVRKVNARGRAREWIANPLWVRLQQDHHEEFGLQRLFLVSRGRRLAIATFLSPEERQSFAKALMRALGEAKRGPTRTVSI